MLESTRRLLIRGRVETHIGGNHISSSLLIKSVCPPPNAIKLYVCDCSACFCCLFVLFFPPTELRHCSVVLVLELQAKAQWVHVCINEADCNNLAWSYPIPTPPHTHTHHLWLLPSYIKKERNSLILYVIMASHQLGKNMVNNKQFSYVSFSQSTYDLFISATKIMTSLIRI